MPDDRDRVTLPRGLAEALDKEVPDYLGPTRSEKVGFIIRRFLTDQRRAPKKGKAPR